MKKWLSRDLLYLYSPTSIEQRIRRQPLENFIHASPISSYDKTFPVNNPHGRVKESRESNAKTIGKQVCGDPAIASSSAWTNGTAHPSVPLRSLFTTRTIQRGERIAFIPFSSVLTGERVYKLLHTHYPSLTQRSKRAGTYRLNCRKTSCAASRTPSDCHSPCALTCHSASSTDSSSSVSVLSSGSSTGSFENVCQHRRDCSKELDQDVDFFLQKLGRIETKNTSWNSSFAELWSRDAILLTVFLFFLKKNATTVKNRSKENHKNEECTGGVQGSEETQGDTEGLFPYVPPTSSAATSSTVSQRVREIQKNGRSWNAVQLWVAHWPPVMPSFGPGLHCLASHDMTFQSPRGRPTTPRCPSSSPPPPSRTTTTPLLSSSTLPASLLSTANVAAAPTTTVERMKVSRSTARDPSVHLSGQKEEVKERATPGTMRPIDDRGRRLANAMKKGVHAAWEEDDVLCVQEKKNAMDLTTCESGVVQRTPQQLKDFFSGHRSSALTVRQHHQQVMPCATIVRTMRRKYLSRLAHDTDCMLRRVREALAGAAVHTIPSASAVTSSFADDGGRRRAETEQEEEADLQDLRWAHFMLRSRGVRLRPRGSDARAWKDVHHRMGRNHVEADDDDDGCLEGLALVPFLDMLNHSATQYNVTYTITASSSVASFPFASSSTRRCATDAYREEDERDDERLSFTRRNAPPVGNDEREGGILVMAARTIGPGEELTMHYGNELQRGIRTRTDPAAFGGEAAEEPVTRVGGDRYVGTASRRVPFFSASSPRTRRVHEEKAIRPQPVSEFMRDVRTKEEFDTLTPPAFQATTSTVHSRSGRIQPLDIRVPEGLLLRAATQWHTHQLSWEERSKGSRTPTPPLHEGPDAFLQGGKPKAAIQQHKKQEKDKVGVSFPSDTMVHHTKESVSNTTCPTLSTSENVRSLAADVQEEEELLHRLCKLYQEQQISPSAVDAKVKAVQARREAEAEIEWIWRFGFPRSEEEVLFEASRRWCSGLRARVAQLTDARRHGRPGEFVLGVPEGLQHLREQRLHLERDRYHNRRIFPPQNHFTPEDAVE